MNKQDFILTELEAIGKDIQSIVDQEKELRATEERSRIERAEQRKKGEVVGVMTRMYERDKFIPELLYLEARLRAVKNYITEPPDPLRI